MRGLILALALDNELFWLLGGRLALRMLLLLMFAVVAMSLLGRTIDWAVTTQTIGLFSMMASGFELTVTQHVGS